MKILMTGSSGFIGKHISKINVSNIRHVLRRGKAVNTNEKADVFYIDSMENCADWSVAFDGIGVIIHLCGLAHSNKLSAQEYNKINVDCTLSLAEQAAHHGVKRFVFVSSANVGLVENAQSKSKYMAEVGLKKIAEKTGIEVVIVRPTLVYGANAPGNFGLLTKLVVKLPVLPFGLTDNKRDFIAVQNLADLLLTCANHPKASGQIFLASDGESVSIMEFTNAIAEGFGKTIVQAPVPLSLMRFSAWMVGKSHLIEQLLGDLQVDSSSTYDVLGWKPPYTMKQAMASLIENTK